MAIPSPDGVTERTKRVALEWVAVQDQVAAYIGSMVRCAADRDDLLQKTVLYLLEHAVEYQGDGFLRWAVTVARYRVLEHWQRRGRDMRLQAMLAPGAEAFMRMEEAGGMEEQSAALHVCLTKLSPDQRRLMERRYVDEVSLPQLADEWKRSVDSLATTFYRIRNMLARCIRQEIGKGDLAS